MAAGSITGGGGDGDDGGARRIVGGGLVLRQTGLIDGLTYYWPCRFQHPTPTSERRLSSPDARLQHLCTRTGTRRRRMAFTEGAILT